MSRGRRPRKEWKMAVATPIIERKISRQVSENAGMTADELHNARMGNNLARLLNPEYKIKDIVASIDAEGSDVVATAPAAEQQVQSTAPTRQYDNGIIARRAPAQEVYTVKNARADADIFRADSAVNRISAQAPAEEENEDLRPTPTTIQYQTISADGTAIAGRSRAMHEGEISRTADEGKSIRLTKRDKIVLGVIVGLILAVFVLIIVNSAVISNLNSDIEYFEGRVEGARAAQSQVAAELEELTSDDHILEVAEDMGWI